MVKRWYHQEVAFEHYLREKDISYLAVDEAKRPVKVDKNFDFLIFAKSGVFITDVKGKQIPYKGGSGFLWETWIHPKDLTGLRQWEDMLGPLFKCPVESLITYVYWVRDRAFLKDFGTTFKRQGKTYGIKAITISKFEKYKEIRGALPPETHEWQLPRKKAKELLKDMDIFLKTSGQVPKTLAMKSHDMPKPKKKEDRIISETAVHILKSKGGRLSLGEIYDGFWESYVGSSPKKGSYVEYTKYGEPRYQHIVRAALNQLKNDGTVDNPQRGIWILKP